MNIIVFTWSEKCLEFEKTTLICKKYFEGRWKGPLINCQRLTSKSQFRPLKMWIFVSLNF